MIEIGHFSLLLQATKVL